MKIKLLNKLIQYIKKYQKKKQMVKKLKLRADMDKTSGYKDADFLNDKKGRR